MSLSPTSDLSQARVLADVGGTNARFAWQTQVGAPLTDQLTLPTSAYDTLQAALEAYLVTLGRPCPPQGAIAIANPVVGDEIRMTNHHWSFSIRAMRESLGMQRLEVLNDFTALALGLPSLRADELRQVGGGHALPDGAVGLLGPGTGLGVSGLVPNGHGGWVPLKGEGGHVSLAAHTPRERAVVEILEQRFGHASAERAISGMGLVDVYTALCALDQRAAKADVTAAQVSEAALAAQDTTATEALSMMCAFLGSVAGNLALTLGAKGGVYIGGGIVPRMGDWFDRSPFRERFESKGRFRGYLSDIPVWVITAQQSPALQGAARALES